MGQTLKSALISDSLMSLKQTLGPFHRNCSLNKVNMRWIELDQSAWLAFSGIYPMRTWLAKFNMGCSWKTWQCAENQKMAGSLVCLCLRFSISTLCLFLSVCLQSEGRVSFTVTTCEIVFHEDGCFLLYSWHPGKHSHLQNCLIWMPWRQTHIHTFITRKNTAHVHTHK